MLFLCIGPYSSGAVGFFLFVAVISFLICRMQDNIPEAGTMAGYNLTDRNFPEDEKMAIDPLNPLEPLNPLSRSIFDDEVEVSSGTTGLGLDISNIDITEV